MVEKMRMGKTRIEFFIDLLYESISLPLCKYYQGDEELCLKYKADDGSSFSTCNCGGDIRKCDLFDFVKIHDLWKHVL